MTWRGRTMWDDTRLAVLRSALGELPQKGALVEIGSHRGGLAVLMATLHPEREVHAFDTYEAGLTGALSEDVFCDGALGHSMDEVERWVASEGIQNVTLHRCDVRTALPEKPEAVALAIVDVDLYEPTRAAIEWLRPRMQPHGTILVDDWHFNGVNRALRESGCVLEDVGYLTRIRTAA